MTAGEYLTEDVDERTDDATAIAVALAALSASEVTPTEVDAVSPFDAEDVSLDPVGLLARSVQVQDWLRLSGPVDRRDPLDRQAARLFDGMGVPHVSACFETNGGALQITEVGLEALRDRAERAVALREKFVEDVEVGGSVEAATAIWVDAWDEADDGTVEGNIIAKTEIWPIQDFASRAKSGRLELSPPYQRSDVWPTKDAQLLIESILRGIPLPSVIILRPDLDGEAPFEVVDGKQRLTSILRFMGAHPDALRIVEQADREHPDYHLKEQFHTNYPAFRRAWMRATGESLTAAQERANYFPFKISGTAALHGDLGALKGKYYSQIKDVRVRVSGSRILVSDLFESAGIDYKIPLITYTEATPQQIHQVFSLYNKQGKHLNAEELRNAVYHGVKLMRALSVASGDTEDLEGAAPFLAPVHAEVLTMQECLVDYNFGEARYRRTKVLSWLASMLFVDSLGPDGTARMRSTSSQINEGLLDRIKQSPGDPFRREEVIRDAVRLLALGIETHSQEPDAWAPVFRDGKRGERWQELQLVASVLGVTMVAAVLGNRSAEAFARHRAELRARTEQRRRPAEQVDHWARPAKTQTATQWRYIATVSLGIVEMLGLDPSQVDHALASSFGVSCVPGLLATRRAG